MLSVYSAAPADCARNFFVISCLNELELICLNISFAIVSAQMVSMIMIKNLHFCLISIICWHTERWFQVLLFKTNYLIQHHSFALNQMVPIIAM